MAHDDLQNDSLLMDDEDLKESLKVVAAVIDVKDDITLKDIVSRKYNIDALGAARLVSLMVQELTHIIAYTPAVLRPTEGGQLLRNTIIDSVQSLKTLGVILTELYEDDEGWDDVKLVKMETLKDALQPYETSQQRSPDKVKFQQQQQQKKESEGDSKQEVEEGSGGADDKTSESGEDSS